MLKHISHNLKTKAEVLLTLLTSDECFYVEEIKVRTLFTLPTYLEYSLRISHSFCSEKMILNTRQLEVGYLNMNGTPSSDGFNAFNESTVVQTPQDLLESIAAVLRNMVNIFETSRNYWKFLKRNFKYSAEENRCTTHKNSLNLTILISLFKTEYQIIIQILGVVMSYLQENLKQSSVGVVLAG